MEAEHQHEIVRLSYRVLDLSVVTALLCCESWILSIQRMLPTTPWLLMSRLLPMAQKHRQVRWLDQIATLQDNY